MAEGGGTDVFSSSTEGRVITIHARYKTGAVVNSEDIPCFLSSRFHQRLKGCFALTRIGEGCFIIEADYSKIPPGSLKLNREIMLLIDIPIEVENEWMQVSEKK